MSPPYLLIKPDLLLVVFIHGFKGSDDTFGVFPGRLQGILRGSIAHAITECVAYPTYKTEGKLSTAVEDFCNWLKHEVSIRVGHDTEKAKVVLCGHSMGGLVAADALIRLNQAPFPRIIACLSFDTPYLGLHDDALPIKKPDAKDVLFWDAAAILLGGPFALVSDFVGRHLSFMASLWKKEELERRLNTIVDYDRRRIVLFRTFFTSLPPHVKRRTFINVPSGTDVAGYFLEAPNHLAKGPIHAHIDMFEPNRNWGYHQLESETARLIGEAVMAGDGVFSSHIVRAGLRSLYFILSVPYVFVKFCYARRS